MQLVTVEFQEERPVLGDRFFELLLAGELGALLIHAPGDQGFADEYDEIGIVKEFIEVSGLAVADDDPAVNVAAVARRAEGVIAYFNEEKEEFS